MTTSTEQKLYPKTADQTSRDALNFEALAEQFLQLSTIVSPNTPEALFITSILNKLKLKKAEPMRITYNAQAGEVLHKIKTDCDLIATTDPASKLKAQLNIILTNFNNPQIRN